VAHIKRDQARIVRRDPWRQPVSDEPTLCVVCAWREECKKKYLQGKDVSLRCPDFTRDLQIKKDKVDAEIDSGKDNK
jgi:hypothetical protein